MLLLKNLFSFTILEKETIFKKLNSMTENPKNLEKDGFVERAADNKEDTVVQLTFSKKSYGGHGNQKDSYCGDRKLAYCGERPNFAQEEEPQFKEDDEEELLTKLEEDEEKRLLSFDEEDENSELTN